MALPLLMAAPLIIGGIQCISGLFKAHKVNKQRKMLEQANCAQMAQMQMMLAQAQGQSAGALGCVGGGYLQPSGFGQQGACFGPAGQGYYPGFC